MELWQRIFQSKVINILNEYTERILNMDNQHKLIKGYRDLSQDEITTMNEIKEVEHEVGRVINITQQVPGVDPRMLAIARTKLQEAFMWWVRSIAKPESNLNPPPQVPR